MKIEGTKEFVSLLKAIPTHEARLVIKDGKIKFSSMSADNTRAFIFQQRVDTQEELDVCFLTKSILSKLKSLKGVKSFDLKIENNLLVIDVEKARSKSKIMVDLLHETTYEDVPPNLLDYKPTIRVVLDTQYLKDEVANMPSQVVIEVVENKLILRDDPHRTRYVSELETEVVGMGKSMFGTEFLQEALKICGEQVELYFTDGGVMKMYSDGEYEATIYLANRNDE